MAKGSKKAKKERTRQRTERRFVPVPAVATNVVLAVGGLGSALMGAGVFGQFGHAWMGSDLPPTSFAPAIIAAGSVVFGASVWLGTSAEQPLRVGAGGIALEKGKEVRRIPWYEVERVVWDPDRQSLSVRGKDDLGADASFGLTAKLMGPAIAWIVKEARLRVPDVVDVPEEAAGLPRASREDGRLLTMDEVQVVGKRCAATNKIIAFEPDARVCPRCERVYLKQSVPDACACGGSLKELQPKVESAAS